jgi:radical SAM superfamily enzyme YgiQ (UPF0313 family)
VKPVERVIEEIRRVKAVWRDPFVEFADDNTFANKAHGKRLLRQIAKEHIRWFTETDISVADDDELLALLQDSGCKQILVGFEAPSRDALESIETRSNWKAKRADSYLEAIERIQRRGITVNGCFILGLDRQTPENFHDVAAFVRKSGLYEVQITLQTPFPSPPLYNRLKSEDRLLADDPWEKCTLFDVTYRPRQMSIGELESHFRLLVRDLYAVEATRARRRRFHRSVGRAAHLPIL